MQKYFKDLERIMSVRELNDLATELAEEYSDREAGGIWILY